MKPLHQDLTGAITSLRPDGTARRPNTWQSVRNIVLARIRSREWAPGELIPTEQELAVDLGCARATVNRALRELADSGIVERRRKVGTRVASTPARRTTIEMPMMSNEIEAMGAKYSYRLHSFESLQASAHVARALKLGVKDPVFQIKCQFLADDRPHCYEVSWLNPIALPTMREEMLREMPAHEWLASNVALAHGSFSILAEAASADCAINLGVADGTPVLVIERTNWADMTPISFARQVYPPGHRLQSEG